jgi:hypothetical protein
VLTSKDVIDARAIRLNQAITKLQSGGRQTMVFVDACRDNPLPPSVRGNQTVNGLAKLGDGVAQNLFVAFATSPGRVSLDGAGDHGPFATALARYLPQPDVPIYLMMTSVRTQVLADTNKGQFPTVEESLLEPFYFNGKREQGLQFGTDDPNAVADTGPNPAAGPVTPPTAVGETTTQVATTQSDAGVPPPGTVELPATPPDVTVAPPSTPNPPPDANAGPSTVTATPPPDQTIATVTPDSVAGPQIVGTEVLRPQEVQTELIRIGCLTSPANGIWNDESKKALQRYGTIRKVAALGTDPTEDTYNLLLEEPGVVCKPPKPKPVVAPRPQVAATPTPRQTPAAQPAAPAAAPSSGGTIKPGFGWGSFR